MVRWGRTAARAVLRGLSASRPSAARLISLAAAALALDSGVAATASAASSPGPTATGLATPARVASGQTVTLTVTVTPGSNPTSTGITVTGDVSQLGILASAVFHDDGLNGDAMANDGIYTFLAPLAANLAGGAKVVNATVTDAQARSTTAGIALSVLGPFTIYHTNDTHARITPDQWIIPGHTNYTGTFEAVGGAAYVASAILGLTAANPSSGARRRRRLRRQPDRRHERNGPIVQYFQLLRANSSLQRGRGVDAIVVGNHDVRSATYIANLDGLVRSGAPVISANVIDLATSKPHYAPYTTVTVNGTNIGILGYTTSASEVGASLSNALKVQDCDWNSTDSTKIHLSSYVTTLRNTLGCDVVILLAHVGHSTIATNVSLDGTTAQALLVDDGTVKLPEIAVTGHWHTWASTAWQPQSLNYKTIFAESASFMEYVGELNVTGAGQYVSSTQHVVRDADYTPDPDVQNLVTNAAAQYDAQNPQMPLRPSSATPKMTCFSTV